VTGRVGSGKTTLALLLTDCEKPETGCIERNGIGSALLSLQFPEYQVTGSTPLEEIRSWGFTDDRILQECGLTGKKNNDLGTLSQGELKLLHLACVLNRNDDLLVLDEPFNMLDPVGKQWVCDRITSRETGITVLMTHEQSIFPRVDVIWEIEQGHLVCVGRVPECLGRWKHIPKLFRNFLDKGMSPLNLRRQDLEDVLCRTRG
jgi:energy-coupling factor transport system ATP-binding protein